MTLDDLAAMPPADRTPQHAQAVALLRLFRHTKARLFGRKPTREARDEIAVAAALLDRAGLLGSAEILAPDDLRPALRGVIDAARTSAALEVHAATVSGREKGRASGEARAGRNAKRDALIRGIEGTIHPGRVPAVQRTLRDKWREWFCDDWRRHSHPGQRPTEAEFRDHIPATAKQFRNIASRR
ncbi:hypothetical protein AAFN86_28785 [Roseomonas sp. CAU 1739]